MKTPFCLHCSQRDIFHEACLKFHYTHPDIYQQLKIIARQEGLRGKASLNIYELLGEIQSPVLEEFHENNPDAQAILGHYQTLLETDFVLWNLFRCSE